MSATSLRSPSRNRRAELEIAAERLGLGVIPAVVLPLMLLLVFRVHQVAVDFRAAYYPAAHRLLHGSSPYAVTHAQIVGGAAFVYPALSAVVFTPFALLSPGFSRVIFMLVCLACVPATLRVLNVRDWRLYGIALMWLPVFSGWQTANLTLPLGLMIALAWRYRDRPIVTGLLVAIAVSLKPFVWPLALWLLATRRFRAAAASLACGLLINLFAWGVVGFNEIHAYLHVSSLVTNALWRGGYGLPALASHLGFGRGPSDGLMLLVSLSVGQGVLYSGLIKRDERRAMALAVGLMLVASPLVRSHYYALLLIPFALYRPRVGWLWFVPILMWACSPADIVAGWQAGAAWVIAAVCMVVLIRGRDTPEAVNPATERAPRIAELSGTA